MTEVNKNQAPYFDDYNEEKNFHEILFRPARAVQVREMNQLQSIFKTQIKRFADHTFEEGSMVIPGETNYDLELNYITLTIDNFATVQNLLVEGVRVESSNGVTADVKIVAFAENSDPHTFYIEYGNSSTDGETSLFTESEVVNLVNPTTSDVITTATILGVGKGSKFTLNTGIYYLNGRFVLVQGQTILLDKYSNTPSKIVCIEYQEEVITADDDSSLFDNASGEPNFNAPGADRLRVNSQLTVYDLDQLDLLPDNAVELFRIQNGEVQKRVKQSQYSVINDTLAQRTYEESGDYTVRSFDLGFDSYQNVFGTADEDKFVAQLGPGVAYVRGYRIETLSKTNLVLDKARSTAVINNSATSAPLGYYITVSLNPGSHLPDISTLQQGTFRNLIDAPLGTARVRFIRRDGSDYRFYLFDIRDNDGNRTTSFLPSAQVFRSTVGNGFDVNIKSSLSEAANNSLVFPINAPNVKSLLDSLGNSDISFNTVKRLTGTLDTNGQISFSAGQNEVFLVQDSTYCIGQFTDDQTEADIVNNYTLGGVVTGSTISIDLGASNASRPIVAYLQVARQEVVQKTKTIQTTSISGSISNNVLSLGKADVIKINSIIDANSNDVTDQFTLNKNITDSYYGVSFISMNANATAVMPITVNFDYFNHSTGDFFTVDSYSSIPYENIPPGATDTIDFRPRISDNGQDFTSTGSVTGFIPTPYTTIRADVEHYLPRIDKIYLKSDGQFAVAKGVPSLRPTAPKDPSDAMVLYTVEVPAYTYSISDVQAIKRNNRRYTMRDIGALENRISNVEYYVSLNSLELEADAKQIIDSDTGLNRFKNGFLTDRFIDHSVGDFAWQNYHVSMSDDGELRPEFSLSAVDLEMNTTSSTGVVVNDGLVTLPFTHAVYVNQNKRSETMNVNPYAIFRWDGNVRLTPSVDSWLDTRYIEPEVTYRVFNNGQLTQQWNSWELSWVGGETTTTETRTSLVSDRIEEEQFGRTVNVNSVMTTMTTTINTTTRTNIDIVDDRVIDTSVIPYMRELEIEVRGEGNRPNSRMYFFFDGVMVNAYVKPVGGAYGNNVVTDADGNFDAIFKIPNSGSLRFKTGQKQFVVTDDKFNRRNLSTSYAETTFTATGIRQVRRRTIVATRNINVSTHSQTQTSTTLIETRWVDPLAQSFLVEKRGGAFITKVEVFFATKDNRVPITLQIREMENGQPTQRVVPGGDKTLHPSQVNVSNDGSVATVFEFSHPVYVLDATEYCFVLMSNSNNYNAWIGRMGERDLGTNQYIVEQPYAGVLFKSQNNSTWTADQTADLQFRIYMAEFDTNATGQLFLQNKDISPIRLPNNPLESINGSNTVRVHVNKHNYVEGGLINISGATSANGHTLAELNKLHTISKVIDPNTIEITLATTGSVNGFFGGSNIVVSDTIQATLLRPNIPTLEPANTSVNFFVRGTRGKSINGTETPFQTFNSFFPIANNANNLVVEPWLIANRLEESQLMSNTRSLLFRLDLQSDNANVSPVVDLQGISVITPCNLITKSATTSPDGSNNYANYRTRVSGLNLAADSLKVFLDVIQPDGSDIIVSARFGNSREETLEATWEEMTKLTGNGVPDRYTELEYDITGRAEYSFYQIMIQLRSSNSAQVPICKRLRAIANYKGA